MGIKNKIIAVMLCSTLATSLIIIALQTYTVYKAAGQNSTLNMGMLEGLYAGVTNSAITLLIAIVVVGSISWIIISRLFRPLGIITKEVSRLGDGDLTLAIDIKSRDEIGILAKTVNDTVKNLQKIVGTVGNNSKLISVASKELAATSDVAGRSIDQVAQTSGEIAQGAEKNR